MSSHVLARWCSTPSACHHCLALEHPGIFWPKASAKKAGSQGYISWQYFDVWQLLFRFRFRYFGNMCKYKNMHYAKSRHVTKWIQTQDIYEFFIEIKNRLSLGAPVALTPFDSALSCSKWHESSLHEWTWHDIPWCHISQPAVPDVEACPIPAHCGQQAHIRPNIYVTANQLRKLK